MGMIRRLLRPIVPISASLILTAGTLFAVATWRRSEDAKWCRNAAPMSALPGDAQPVDGKLVEQERAACLTQRQRQRSVFGAVWRAGGPEMAECGFVWARYQMRTYMTPEAAAAVLAQYGIDEALEPSSREDQDRFIRACRSNGLHEAR
jgi:hypothetical protein